MTARQLTRGLICSAWSIAVLGAQEPTVEPIRASLPILRWYQPPQIPAIRLANSGRLANLVRAGMLYLTVQDAIALALENNIDIEVARYNPILSVWQLERS